MTARQVARGFGERLHEVFELRGRLCVGIDPHPFLLEQWGLDDDAVALREFGLRVVDAVADRAGMVKPQIAFFERHGSRGYRALEDVLGAARDAALLVIADAKRGDIGTSVEAYGRAWLTPGAPLESDALTVSPYLGVGALSAVLTLAAGSGKGVFVLAATSNPEAVPLQSSRTATGDTVAAAVLDAVDQANAHHAGDGQHGDAGVVLGATADLTALGIDTDRVYRPSMPALVPGFGQQGGSLAEARGLLGAFAPHTIVNDSRSLLAAGRDGLAEAILRRLDEVETSLG